MAGVIIKKTPEEIYLVNGKSLYQDSNNNWVSKEELTSNEAKAFRLHLNKVTGPCENYKRP